MKRRLLVAANWKMNGSLGANRAWAEEFASLAAPGCDVLVCAPFVYLSQMGEALSGTVAELGAEDVSEYAAGAYTGETSAAMLGDLGVKWVIVGHSERRTLFGDTDARAAAKVKAAASAGLKPILCVGETLAEREAGRTLEVVVRQLAAVISEVQVSQLGALAYEPVWAIGTGLTATPEAAQEVHAALRAEAARAESGAAAALRILYGGSVKASNAASLFSMPDIDGGLIGGASLKAGEFHAICSAAAAQQAF